MDVEIPDDVEMDVSSTHDASTQSDAPTQNDAPTQDVDMQSNDNTTANPEYTYIVTMTSPFPLTNDTHTTKVHLTPMIIELTKLPLACLQVVTPEEACLIPFNEQNRVPTRMNTITLLTRLAFVIANRCDATKSSLGNIIRQRVVESLTATYDMFMFSNQSRRDVELKLYSSQVAVNGVMTFHRKPLIESRVEMTKYVVNLMRNAVAKLYLNGSPVRSVTYIDDPVFAQENPFQPIEQDNLNQMVANRSELLAGCISALPVMITNRCISGEPVPWADASYSYIMAVYRMLGKQ